MIQRLTDRLRNAGRSEEGFTVVEAVIGAMIMVVGMLATFQILDSATRNAARAEGTQVAIEVAQREMEELRALDYDEVALTATPPTSSNPSDPRNRVSGSTFALNRDGTNPATMVVNGGSIFGGGTIIGGVVNPGPETFSSGQVSGRIYRFVVWRNDPACTESLCGGGQDYKEVVVAVRIDQGAGYDRGYVETQSGFVDPEKTTYNEPEPGPSGVVTAQQFYLSDIACETDGSTARPDPDLNPPAEHLLHNTLGTCDSLPQTGTTAGAPDTLMLGGPPDRSPADPADPILTDYSNDFYLEPSPDTDKGLQVQRQDVSGCAYNPGGANPQGKIHRWVTDPLPTNFVLEGRATLEFFTRTINDSLHTGRLCVYLFRRSQAGSIASDALYTNWGGVGVFGHGTGSFGWQPAGSGFWPRSAWTKVRLTMTFRLNSTTPCLCTIPAGQRLGIAISVDRAVTPADAIPILYDHPNYPTRLEVETTTPIQSG
jgi:type II secretory pathway pseudopilin PulG